MVVAYSDEQPTNRYSLRPRSSARVNTHYSPPLSPPVKKRAAASSTKLHRINKKLKRENATAVVAAVAPVEEGADARVTETLRKFNIHYLQFTREEENKLTDLNRLNSKSKVQKNEKAEDATKKRPKRADLKAMTEMKKTNAYINPEKRFGSIPGINVGHQFFSRAEMVVVGLHRHWLFGIDYIGKNANKELRKTLNLKRNMLPLTTSIVMSGQYEDDVDGCEEIIYTGQGGNDYLGRKCQIAHQKLACGNLGLKNCMEQSIPVRVIRGHKCKSSYVGVVYTYDGLYNVTEYWPETGISGFTVYKFKLKRIAGQPALTTKEVTFTRVRGRISRSISETRGLVCEDISGGLENIRIPVINLVDDATNPSEGFDYIKELKFSKDVPRPTIPPPGCGCRDSCTDPTICACAKLNGGDFPYVQKDGGRLVKAAEIVFECGPNCGCGPDCVNRTSQRGLRFHLEVFRTRNKGWGVRSVDYIPSGAFVCEYIGLVKRSANLDHAADDTYVFDIDCLQTIKGLDGRESRLRDVPLPAHLNKTDEESSDNVPFCIDAAETGNFARFINHSCNPNLFVQCVLSDHDDINRARVMFVAFDNIPPLQELTYDYGYAIDSVVDADGKIRQMPCFCGADACRKRLY